MRIQELSKVPMYEFHYNYIKNKYFNKSRLLFTDTDRLAYKIETENVYEFVVISNYSAKSRYDDESNTVAGKMKMKWAALLLKNLLY